MASEQSVIDLLDGVPEATPEALSAAIKAAGITGEQAAAAMALAGRQSVQRAKTVGTERWRLALLLLATGQHPTLTINAR